MQIRGKTSCSGGFILKYDGGEYRTDDVLVLDFKNAKAYLPRTEEVSLKGFGPAMDIRDLSTVFVHTVYAKGKNADRQEGFFVEINGEFYRTREFWASYDQKKVALGNGLAAFPNGLRTLRVNYWPGVSFKAIDREDLKEMLISDIWV